MKEITARKLIIEHLEQRYQKPYKEVCLSCDFNLKFMSEEKSGEECRNRATWIASFFEDLTHCVTEFFPVRIEIYLDDETEEIWTPSDPDKKLTPQEKRANRKERRQIRRNSSKN